MSLPPFLKPLPSNKPCPPYRNAVFHHKGPLGAAHALWWPTAHPSSPPETVIFFIPGNPGLLDFYIPFLAALYSKDTSSKLAIFGHSHLGHAPGIPPECASSRPIALNYGLAAQVEGALEAFDAIKSTYGVSTRVIIIGHSVGAWISLQVLKARPIDATALFLLFPTICHIADTPNGRRLSWLFSPLSRHVLSSLSYITRLFPVRFLTVLFRDWPLPQILVLRALLHSPRSIHAALGMAYDEMKVIRDLDLILLNECKSRLWFYFADQDDWIGEQKSNLLRSFEPDPEVARVIHAQQDIPHAFCINHGEQVAEQCYWWLNVLRERRYGVN